MDISIFEDKELLVRKRLSSFLEKLMKGFGYDLDHDVYKKVMYAEDGYTTEKEKMVKHYYDAYLYLLSNRANHLTSTILKRFFYIVEGNEIDEGLSIQIASKAFHFSHLPPVEQAVHTHMAMYQLVAPMGEEKQTILSLMIMNFILVKHGIPSIHFLYEDMRRYEKCRKEYLDGNDLPLIACMFDIISESKVQSKSFYKNLTPLTCKDIYDRISKDKDMLVEKYQIKSMSIFGSFAKNKQRLDSDIDIMATFSQDLTYDEKIEIKEQVSKYYFDIFHRFVDITEVTEYTSDALIDVVRKYKKIY